MKKLDLIMLFTGLIALVLSIITAFVLVFVFVAAVKAEVKTGKIEEGFKQFEAIIDENINVIDGEGIHIDSDGTVVDITVDGISVREDGNNVNISSNGISVSEG